VNDRLNLALLYGSTREGRFCDVVVNWAMAQIANHGGYAVDPVDPARLALPDRHERHASTGLRELRHRLDAADAFIVVTPEYNHSYPAVLKFVIDSTSREWAAKPVAFISYGGISGGLRAVEHLRGVFAELHATTVRDVVSFANASGRFGADGRLRDGEEAEAAMTRMLRATEWWGKALRNARHAEPYAKAAA
jgi:NAD(P)H-dependent FMN reductase